MIKDFKQWQRYRARLFDSDITPEEDQKILESMKKFESENPKIFRKLRREGMVGSLSYSK